MNEFIVKNVSVLTTIVCVKLDNVKSRFKLGVLSLEHAHMEMINLTTCAVGNKVQELLPDANFETIVDIAAKVCLKTVEYLKSIETESVL